MEEETVHFSSSAGKLAGIIHYPKQLRSCCVIACHGLYSDKGGDKFVAIGKCLAKEGIAVFRFDFRGCGESDGRIEDTTITGRKDDLIAALSFIKAHNPSIAQTIGLLGSSMGGYISLLVASLDQTIKGVVAWATPFSFDGLKEAIENSYSPPLKEGFYHDAKHYDANQFVPRLHNTLFIHGDSDEIVPFYHAKEWYQSAKEPKRLEIVKGADHTFSKPKLRDKAITQSLNWFKQFLLT